MTDEIVPRERDGRSRSLGISTHRRATASANVIDADAELVRDGTLQQPEVEPVAP